MILSENARTQAQVVSDHLRAEGYIHVTWMKGGGEIVVNKFIHPKTGKLFMVETLQRGVEVYESTETNSLDHALKRITLGART